MDIPALRMHAAMRTGNACGHGLQWAHDGGLAASRPFGCVSEWLERTCISMPSRTADSRTVLDGWFPRFRGKPRFRPMTHETTETAPRIEMGTWMPSPHPVLSLPVRTVSFSRKPKKRKRRESEKHTGFAPSHLASHHLVCRNAVYPHVSESLPQNG